MRDCLDRRVTPLKRVTSPTWGPSPVCKQALSLIRAKQQLCTCSALFCTFLNRHCMIMTWKSLISRFSSFMEDINKRGRFFLSLSKLGCDSQEISSREIRLHFTFSAKWKKPDKVWKKASSSDVFAALAVVDEQRFIFFRDMWVRENYHPHPSPTFESSLLPGSAGPLTGREAFGTCHVAYINCWGCQTLATQSYDWGGGHSGRCIAIVFTYLEKRLPEEHWIANESCIWSCRGVRKLVLTSHFQLETSSMAMRQYVAWSVGSSSCYHINSCKVPFTYKDAPEKMISIWNIFLTFLSCRINRLTARWPCYSVCWESHTIDSLPAWFHDSPANL